MDANSAIQQLGLASLGISRLIGRTPFSDSPEDQALLTRLFRERDRINWTAQQLIGADLSGAVADYGDECATIGKATEALKAVESAVQSAKNVLDLANQVVSIGSSILAKVAT
jgi:hypothetical protein